MLCRFVVSLLFFSLVGQWLYREAQVVAPSTVPYIDQFLAKVSIPTHDQWSQNGFNRVLRGAAIITDQVVHQVRSDTKQHATQRNSSPLATVFVSSQSSPVSMHSDHLERF